MPHPTRLLLATLAIATTAVAGEPTIHVRDLDPRHMPTRLNVDEEAGRLRVDGALVKGSRARQIDYLHELFADASGEPPPELRLDERRRAARRIRQGEGAAQGAAFGVIGAGLLVPPVALVAVAAGGVGVVVAGHVGSRKARATFDAEGFDDAVSHAHARALGVAVATPQ
jgi:hypothetical protein